MTSQTLALENLASVFQLIAGVALAMSVFRTPFERRYQRLGAILDREEIILRGRNDQNALGHGDAVLAARAGWLAKGREMEPVIRRYEFWIWVSVVLGCAALVSCSLWPTIGIARPYAILLLLIVATPLFWGSFGINFYVRQSLAVITGQIERL